MSTPIPDDVRPLIEEVCAELGLDRFAARTVERWVREGPEVWGSCCMSGCSPCNDVLRAAAKRVLKALDATAG